MRKEFSKKLYRASTAEAQDRRRQRAKMMKAEQVMAASIAKQDKTMQHRKRLSANAAARHVKEGALSRGESAHQAARRQRRAVVVATRAARRLRREQRGDTNGFVCSQNGIARHVKHGRMESLKDAAWQDANERVTNLRRGKEIRFQHTQRVLQARFVHHIAENRRRRDELSQMLKWRDQAQVHSVDLVRAHKVDAKNIKALLASIRLGKPLDAVMRDARDMWPRDMQTSMQNSMQMMSGRPGAVSGGAPEGMSGGAPEGMSGDAPPRGMGGSMGMGTGRVRGEGYPGDSLGERSYGSAMEGIPGRNDIVLSEADFPQMHGSGEGEGGSGFFHPLDGAGSLSSFRSDGDDMQVGVAGKMMMPSP
jgi:hypothetical protein